MSVGGVTGAGGAGDLGWDRGLEGPGGAGGAEGADGAEGAEGSASDATGHPAEVAPPPAPAEGLRRHLEAALAAGGAGAVDTVSDPAVANPGTATMREALALVFCDERSLGIIAGVTRHEKSPSRLFERLLAGDGRISDLEVMDLVWAATDHGRINRREFAQLEGILQDHPDKFTTAGREGLAGFLDDMRAYQALSGTPNALDRWPFVTATSGGDAMLEAWHEKNLVELYGPNWRDLGP